MFSETFDYVIVGAGTAGCVLANRLSTNPSVRVLLIEAGGSDANPLISIPLGMGKLHAHGMYDWGMETQPEPALDNRRLEAMRGKVLGGCSSINVMAYTRGHPNDFNQWAGEGAAGWSYADVLPYFKRSEHWEGGESEFRGGDGPLGTQYARTTDPIFEAWKRAGAEAGFPTTVDYNAASQEGFGRSQYTIDRGRRASSARAYLRPVLHRPNLVVHTGAHVLNVVLEGTRAVGVRYVRGGERSARASSEVLLCAGAFNTPHLLMHSGIGPTAELSKHGIRTLVSSPSVGQNLQDHLGLWITWKRKQLGTFHRQMRFDRMASSMLRAYLFGTGPATTVPGGLHAFIKTRPHLSVPDIEFMFHTVPPSTRLWFPLLRPSYEDGYAIRPTLLHPRSRGHVSLASADPRDHVNIAFNFFSDPDDLPRLREGFKIAREVGEQDAMDEFRGAELSPGPQIRTDAEIDAFIRKSSQTAHHPCGTCSMGASDDDVLDPQLRVRGVEALRVVDASAMPGPVSGHPNACIFMMAEKAADLVLHGSRPHAAPSSHVQEWL